MAVDAVGADYQSCVEIAVVERTPAPVTQASPPAAKIALFRSFFRGREDVYPRRFESRKSGKGGYAPACANETVRGVCEEWARSPSGFLSYISISANSFGTQRRPDPRSSVNHH